jgi:hypothetical protein
VSDGGLAAPADSGGIFSTAGLPGRIALSTSSRETHPTSIRFSAGRRSTETQEQPGSEHYSGAADQGGP